MDPVKKDIHGIDRDIHRVLSNVRNNTELQPGTKKILLGLYEVVRQTNKKSTSCNHIVNLYVLAKDNPGMNFSDLKKKNVKKLSKQIRERNIHGNTKYKYGNSLRRLLLYSKKEKYSKYVVFGRVPGKKKTASDILSSEDVIQLILAGRDVEEKAFIASTFEGGFRIGEIGTIGIGDVRQEEVGISLAVSGKTGERRSRLIVAAAYFEKWLSEHPDKNNMDAPVWIKNGKQMMYPAFVKIIKRVSKLTGLEKKVHLHLLRHSGCTNAANHMTESQMREYFGWSGDSAMPMIYVHLSKMDVDRSVLKQHGIELDVVVDRFTVRKCEMCGHFTPIFEERCVYCV